MNKMSATIDLADFPRRHGVDFASPFRYPGGKGSLTGLAAKFLEQLPEGPKEYAEPFCGGAGVAVNLLRDGLVGHIHLNDLDPCIYSAWRAILCENDRFLDRLEQSPVNIQTWRDARRVVDAAEEGYDFELGFAAYFINRTSRAGIIVGSGPIGGHAQSGELKVDARFYRDTMLQRIRWIGEHAGQISVSNLNAIDFLRELPQRAPIKRTLIFADPPYFRVGKRLYLDGMQNGGHVEFSEFVTSHPSLRWFATYDDHPDVYRLYKTCNIHKLESNYSIRGLRTETELLIVPREGE